MKEKTIKIEFQNGEYYIGQCLNNKMHGKGKLYYKKNRLKYEGEFVNNKFEGKGKFIFQNGECYLGEFKNNKRNGKGILYNKDKTIKYKGYFKNDKYIGEINNLSFYIFSIISVLILIIACGLIYFFLFKEEKAEEKIYLDNFNYYIGQHNDGIPNGKGKKFNKDNKLIYSGNFIKGAYEGIGHLSLGNDNYYYGNFKKGRYNGKGILYHKYKNIVAYLENPVDDEANFYFKNENQMISKFNNVSEKKDEKLLKYDVIVQYEGDFVNGEMNGNGKQLLYYYEVYIGQFKNNKREGKGIIYYNNTNFNKKRYEGEFHDDHITGIGKYYHENGFYTIGQFIQGIRNGQGKMYDINKKLYYDGNFVNDKFNGYGKIYQKGVLYYEGNFENDEIQGKGKKYIYDGNYITGQFNKGIINGLGKFYHKNGKIIFEGEFINGEINGKGKLYTGNNYIVGNFNNFEI